MIFPPTPNRRRCRAGLPGAPPPSELLRALGVLAEAPTQRHRRLAGILGLPEPPPREDFTELFLFQVYPYASVYLGPEGMMGGEARERIAGFWRAVGRTPPPDPDHLAALLGLLADVLEEGSGEGQPTGGGLRISGSADEEEASRLLARRAAQVLLRDHLVSWVPPFLDRVAALGGGFYQQWACILRDTLAALTAASEEAREETLEGTCAEVDANPGNASGAGAGHAVNDALGDADGAPSDVRDVPGVPDPRESGGMAFLEGLFAPARSGVIVTRYDLVALGRTLELGLRVGERRFILNALLDQEPTEVLRALADWIEARREEYAAWPEPWVAERRRWRARAARTEALLTALATEGETV